MNRDMVDLAISIVPALLFAIIVALIIMAAPSLDEILLRY